MWSIRFGRKPTKRVRLNAAVDNLTRQRVIRVGGHGAGAASGSPTDEATPDMGKSGCELWRRCAPDLVASEELKGTAAGFSIIDIALGCIS